MTKMHECLKDPHFGQQHNGRGLRLKFRYVHFALLKPRALCHSASVCLVKPRHKPRVGPSHFCFLGLSMVLSLRPAFGRFKPMSKPKKMPKSKKMLIFFHEVSSMKWISTKWEKAVSICCGINQVIRVNEVSETFTSAMINTCTKT